MLHGERELVDAFYLSATVIVEQDIVVGIALLSHHSCSYLTEADTMSPPCSEEYKALGHPIIHLPLIYNKCTAIEMGLTERTAYLELLTYGERFLATHNLEFADTPTLTTLYCHKVEDGAKVVFLLLTDELREFLLGVLHTPAIEIYRLLIVVVEHL